MSAIPSQFARAFTYQGLSQLAQAGITVLLMPLVIKSAGAESYGGYVVLNSLITLTTMFLTLGLGFKCRRALPAATDTAARAAVFLPSFSAQFLTALLAAVVLTALLPGLNRLAFGGAIGIHPVVVVLAVLALFSTNVTDDYFRYTHRIPLLSKAIVLRCVLHPGLVLFAAATGWRLSANLLIALQAVSWLVVSGWLGWRIHREIPLRFRLDSRPTHLADLRLGFPLISAVIVENLLAVSDRYILAGYLSPAQVGAYAAAATLGNLALMLPRIANSALQPTLAQAVDTGREEDARAVLRDFLQVFFMLAIPFVAGAALLGRVLLLWLGNAEVAALAGWAMPLLAMASVLNGYCYLKFNALFVTQKTLLWLRANAAAAAVSIGLNLLLVGWLRRLEVAAFVSVLSYGVAFLIVRSSADGWPLRLDRSQLLRSVLAAAGMVLVLAGALRLPLFATADSARVLALVTLGAGTYFGLLAALGGYTPRRFLRALGF